MNSSKPINALKRRSPPFIERFITKRAPIRTYNYSKGIRGAKPYISFIYIDTDTLPTIINISLDRPDLYKLYINDTQQVELHVLFQEDEGKSNNGNVPHIKVHTLDGKSGTIEITISYKATDTSIRLSPSFTVLSIIEQKASLDAVFDLDKEHNAISTTPYIFDSKPVQYTNATAREKEQYDSYNHSLAIIEPRRFDYRVSNTRTRNKMARYHRYYTAHHIVSIPEKA